MGIHIMTPFYEKVIAPALRRFEHYITGDDSERNLQTKYWIAQTFTPSVSHTITKVKLLLYRYGSPGTIGVYIYATDVNGHPTGSELRHGNTNGSTLPTASPYEWREITLDTPLAVVAGIKYAIVVKLGGSGANYLIWRMDSSSPTYVGGCGEYTANSGGDWTSYTNWDFMFEEWGYKT